MSPQFFCLCGNCKEVMQCQNCGLQQVSKDWLQRQQSELGKFKDWLFLQEINYTNLQKHVSIAFKVRHYPQFSILSQVAFEDWLAHAPQRNAARQQAETLVQIILGAVLQSTVSRGDPHSQETTERLSALYCRLPSQTGWGASISGSAPHLLILDLFRSLHLVGAGASVAELGSVQVLSNWLMSSIWNSFS